MRSEPKIVVTGAAGLVGQNLVPRLKAQNAGKIFGIDKSTANSKILAELNPGVEVVVANLSRPGDWEAVFEDIDVLVLNHAQIGGLDENAFFENNIVATNNVIDAAKRHGAKHVICISSSTVNSISKDLYAETKRMQEALVVKSGLPFCVLRPTLMFGWFDRKHLGWLARFMRRTPIFPVPGDGRYLRQPLYAGDFCNIIVSCIRNPKIGQAFNISGQEKIEFIDLIRDIKLATKARARIVPIPYAVFWRLLKTYSFFDKNPPFTTRQLEALVAPDVFEVIDWPFIFDVPSTPLLVALTETFTHPVNSKITLEF